MSSVFKKSEEELKSQAIEGIDFDSLLEQGIKKCNLDAQLELLLYDVSDALKEKQILLVEAKKGREEAYLIPLMLAYQNTTYFRQFIIATSSRATRETIIRKIKELSKLLNVDIPVHVLESEKNYFCLKKLKGYNKKRKQPVKNCNPNAMGKGEWRKIQVRNCTLTNCSFFKRCKYAIDYSALSKNGCIIITHATLIGNRRLTQTGKRPKNGDLIVIDEAEKFANSIRDSYQQVMSYDYICNCFSRAKQLLNRAEYSYITNKHFIELENFFKQLSHCKKGDSWKVTPELKRSSKSLAAIAKRMLIHLTRQGAIKNFSSETESFCEMIFIIEKFFEEIADSHEKFHALLQEKDRSPEAPEFRKVQVLYYPKKVDTIITDSLRAENCSIVFTGEKIAGQDSNYNTLCGECGIAELGKEVVKEYVLK